jgi:DNA polymerase-3 subunit alpha
MGKSLGHAEFDKYREEFLQGCKKQKTVPEKKSEKIWDMMSKFGGYGFNVAHAVEYSMITYWDMFVKTYYPNEFLTHGDKAKNVEYIREAKRLGLKINLPKIGISDTVKWNCDKKGNLYAPFTSINGVQLATAEKIANLKSTQKKKRCGFFNLQQKEKYPGINKNVIEILEKIKAFDPDYITTKEDLKKYKQYFIF